jgi:hypothetical protein
VGEEIVFVPGYEHHFNTFVVWQISPQQLQFLFMMAVYVVYFAKSFQV